MDYGLPRADDLPRLSAPRSRQVLSPTNPLGIKAGGELGNTAAPAAVIAAIVDASTRLPGFATSTMPATPYNDVEGDCRGRIGRAGRRRRTPEHVMMIGRIFLLATLLRGEARHWRKPRRSRCRSSCRSPPERRQTALRAPSRASLGRGSSGRSWSRTSRGAGGSLGLSLLARAAPDGDTLSVGATGALVIGPHLPGAAAARPAARAGPDRQAHRCSACGRRQSGERTKVGHRDDRARRKRALAG